MKCAAQGGDTFKSNAKCDAPAAMVEVHKACWGKESCTLKPVCGIKDEKGGINCILVEGGALIPDPCHMVAKHLSVAIQCATDAPLEAPITAAGGGGDGETTVIKAKWHAIDSYIESDDPWVGCTTNWTKAAAREGWDTAGFASAKLADWAPAAQSAALLVSQLPTPRVSALPPTAVMRSLAPVSVDKLANGDWVYTFPENFVGVAQVFENGHAVSAGSH